MPRFAQIENALADLSANYPTKQGRHLGEGVKAGARGVTIGEVPFDPARHSPSKINPLALSSLITGEPHVTQAIPNRPIEANIIIHNDPKPNRRDIHQTKFALAETLADKISGSMPAFRDRVNLYLIGEETDDRRLDKLGVEMVEGTDDPVKAAAVAADLCMNGLAFVISDFENLPIHELNHKFKGTIGIKTNHELDLDISSIAGNKAVLSLGGSREVRLWKPKEVIAFNEKLQENDQLIESRLERVGIKVARVISSQSEYNGYNLRSADNSIARAINRLGS
jgi:hypothetical protein